MRLPSVYRGVPDDATHLSTGAAHVWKQSRTPRIPLFRYLCPARKVSNPPPRILPLRVTSPLESGRCSVPAILGQFPRPAPGISKRLIFARFCLHCSAAGHRAIRRKSTRPGQQNAFVLRSHQQRQQLHELRKKLVEATPVSPLPSGYTFQRWGFAIRLPYGEVVLGVAIANG
jgi:hypothetical protein